jgi:hypothetical protein
MSAERTFNLAGDKLLEEIHVLDTAQRTPAATPDDRRAKARAVELSS